MRGQTLRESFTDDTRTKTLRLYQITGERIARLPIDEAIEKYGNWKCCSFYSESFTEVSVWILDTTK